MSVNVFFLLLLLLLALYVCCAVVFDGYVRFLFIWIGDAWMDERDGERVMDALNGGPPLRSTCGKKDLLFHGPRTNIVAS